jgi:hypothetical protein
VIKGHFVKSKHFSVYGKSFRWISEEVSMRMHAAYVWRSDRCMRNCLYNLRLDLGFTVVSLHVGMHRMRTQWSLLRIKRRKRRIPSRLLAGATSALNHFRYLS